MHLNYLDFAVLLVYFAVLIGIGLYFARRQTSQETYFLADRKMPWFAVGISVLATLLSTNTYLATPGEMIKFGIGFFASNLAYILIIPSVNYIVIPSLMRLPVTSVYEYMERRYGTGMRGIAAAAFVFTRLIWIGLIIYTASFATAQMTGWEIWVIVLIVGGATIFYTTIGGVSAVIWTDFMQAVLLFGGALFIPCYVAVKTASTPAAWWGLFSQAGRADVPIFSLDPTVRISVVGMVMSVFLWHLCTHGADQIAAQRYLTTTSLRAARRSVWTFSVSFVCLSTLLTLCGVALFYFYAQRSGQPVQQFQAEIAARADKALPQFIATELPHGLAGLVLSALLAAAMSSLSSGMNSISTVIWNDFMKRRQATVSVLKEVRTAKILSLVAGVLGIAFALAVDRMMRLSAWNLVDLMERVNHLFVAPLGALFLTGIFFRHMAGPAAFLGFVAGVATSILLAFSKEIFHLSQSISFMWIMPLSFLVSLIVSALAGFVFPRPSPTQLEGMSVGRLPTQRPVGLSQPSAPSQAKVHPQ
jgi:SSS family solute:Na+ symporter